MRGSALAILLLAAFVGGPGCDGLKEKLHLAEKEPPPPPPPPPQPLLTAPTPPWLLDPPTVPPAASGVPAATASVPLGDDATVERARELSAASPEEAKRLLLPLLKKKNVKAAALLAPLCRKDALADAACFASACKVVPTNKACTGK